MGACKDGREFVFEGVRSRCTRRLPQMREMADCSAVLYSCAVWAIARSRSNRALVREFNIAAANQ